MEAATSTGDDDPRLVPALSFSWSSTKESAHAAHIIGSQLMTTAVTHSRDFVVQKMRMSAVERFDSLAGSTMPGPSISR
jgi:hypothetical protein